jgi:hypothetical protein
VLDKSETTSGLVHDLIVPLLNRKGAKCDYIFIYHLATSDLASFDLKGHLEFSFYPHELVLIQVGLFLLLLLRPVHDGVVLVLVLFPPIYHVFVVFPLQQLVPHRIVAFLSVIQVEFRQFLFLLFRGYLRLNRSAEKHSD